MAFGNESFDVHRFPIESVGWPHRRCAGLNRAQHTAKNQLLRASQSTPLNRAEGVAKATDADRRRFLEIARESALEYAAIQDVLEVCDALPRERNAAAKRLLDRMVAMLTKLGQRGDSVHEPTSDDNRMGGSDPDADTDSE
ncbi:MAG: four helix bundle protein [Gammaproteobacteria bacterium]|nr:four helix bundle protein [Gammaproteobacteria bacterium]